MLTCPLCATPNQEGSASCGNCNCALAEVSETIASEAEGFFPDGDATVVATAAFSAVSGAAPARAFAELPIGRLLNDRYEVLARLGQGGMGTVYKVLDRELDRIIALKTIRPDLASNPQSLRRLKQETLLARQIAHRNVIRVFDLGVAEGLRFITMEFVAGQDLRALLDARSKLTVEETRDLLTQIGNGLAAAHGEDVVHRDLKPHNILLASDGRVRLVDFGLARSFEDTRATRTGGLLGTPTYMSPEQALGHPGDARSDIFAFGVIAFELLAGQLPFPNHPLSEALVSRTRGHARSLAVVDPSIPGWLVSLVMRCLERNPADRFATAEQLLKALEARGHDAFSSTHPPSAATIRGAQTELTPGDMLGSRYRIEAEAGEGAIGKVYRATDLDLHRTVALKVVRPELAGDPQSLDQLIQEISVASQISHKNILRIHDLGEADGLRFVSMAWAEGENLSQLLHRTGPLPESRIRELALQLCDGLMAAHEQGISHRDLKPSNILFSSAGHVCIADFGLARSAADSALSRPSAAVEAGSCSGTPLYMSPEQVDGASVDCRTDIYSLGLILYEMATGRIPFSESSVVQTITQRLTESPASPRVLNSGISEQLAAVILRCLERDPAARYPTVEAVRADLAQPAKSSEPQTAIATHALPASTSIKRWWPAIAAVALLLMIAGAATIYNRRKTPMEPPAKGKYVAVLPFRSLGSDANLKYRAEGIAEAVSARLASLNSVHPISSAALEHVNMSEPETDIGRQIGANLLVEGTVQSEGDRIKVDVEIYNTRNHKAHWATYQRAGADLFALEDQIADDTEKALDVTPSFEERQRQATAPTQNLAAYDLYLKGRDILRNHRDEDSARSALALFEQACRLDSSFALAWTGIADASNLLYRITHNSADSTKAVAAAEQAKQLNPDLPEVHFALGSAYSATGRNAEAISELKAALALSPNSDNGYIRLGRAYLDAGQGKQSLESAKKAVDLNPYYWFNHKQLGYVYAKLGQPGEARKEFQQEVAQNPSDVAGYNNVAATYLEEAQWSKAVPEIEKAVQLGPGYDEYSNLGTAYYHLGRYGEAIAAYRRALTFKGNHPEGMRNLAEAYAQNGQHSLAEQNFTKAIGLLYDELEVNHENAHAFAALALCYTGLGNNSRARQMIAKARAIDGSDSSFMYDQASVEASSGQTAEAVAALRKAFEHGEPFENVLTDPDMKSVRNSPEFKSLKRQFGHPRAKDLR